MLAFDRPDGSTLVVRITGDWTTGNSLPSAGEVEKELSSGVRRVAFDAAALGKWDSGLLTFLLKVFDRCSAEGIAMEKSGLPPGIVRLLDLATAVPERKEARREAKREPFLARVGSAADAQRP
jgi:phospholipid/cholesterol/gamma-HCH transport system permease protein